MRFLLKRPMSRLRLLLCPALFALLLAGCTTTAPTPPAPAVELPPASISGSEESSTMLDNFTAYVVAVDGVPVAAGRAGWSAALPLKPGPRRLSLAFARGVFTARAELTLDAVSQSSYQVKFATDAQLFGKNSYCEFWVVDQATGQPVTPRVRATLARNEADGNDAAAK